MKRIHRYLLLPWRDKLLLFQAAALLLAVRVGLALIPFLILRRMLTCFAGAGASAGATVRQEDIERVVWALSAVARTFPSAGTCLMQALAGYVLLGRKGCHTDLRIGVTREAHKLFAHAWLEKDHTVVIGEIGTERERYTALPALRGLEPLYPKCRVRTKTTSNDFI